MKKLLYFIFVMFLLTSCWGFFENSETNNKDVVEKSISDEYVNKKSISDDDISIPIIEWQINY